MSGDDFRAWLSGNSLSNQTAADVFGLSLASIKKYKRAGAPALVARACRAMSAEPLRLAAHYRPRRPGRPRTKELAS